MSAVRKPDTSVVASVTQFSTITVRHTPNHSWAVLNWSDNGQVSIISDHGNWAYWWSGAGVSMPLFLSSLNCDYMGGKLLGDRLHVFDIEATSRNIMESILNDRKLDYCTKEIARQEWDLAQELDQGEIGFESWMEKTSLGDACEYGVRTICTDWSCFWQNIWVPYIKPELQRLADIEAAMRLR